MKECPRCGACRDDTEVICQEDGSHLVSTLDGPPLLGGRLQLERRLGKGGMGVVYRALHLGLQKAFAVKVIRQAKVRDPDLARRFEVEAKALGRLDHPNIVRVTDFGIDDRGDGIRFLVMELLEGEKLSTLIQKGPIQIEEGMTILELIARSIDFAHRSGVLHRDLKPDNVIVRVGSDGGPDVKVLDFGLAKMIEQPSASVDAEPMEAVTPQVRNAVSVAGILVGTPGYMAPEIVHGKIGPACDVYSFGVIAYEVLAGRPPFAGSAEELIEQHLKATALAPSTINPQLPPCLDGPIIDALEKDPEMRSQTAVQVVAKLRRAYSRMLLQIWKKKELPRRLALAGCLTALLLLLGLPAVHSQLVRALDTKFADAWVYLTPPRLMSARILIVPLPDDFWDLPGDAGRLASGIDRFFQSGARCVALDLILPDRFGKDPQFARMILQHQDALVLSAASLDDGAVKGTGAVSGFATAALGAHRAGQLFGIVTIDEDADGVVRRYAMRVRDAAGRIRPSLAERAGRILEGTSWPADPMEVMIDFSIDWQRNMLDWNDAMEVGQRDGSLSFRERLILVSGKSELGEDLHRVPHSSTLPGRISGAVIHAQAVDTVATGRLITPVAALPVIAVLGGVMTGFAFSLLWSGRIAIAFAVLPALAAAHAGAAFALFRGWQVAIPVTLPLTGLLAISLLAPLLRRRLPSRPSRES